MYPRTYQTSLLLSVLRIRYLTIAYLASMISHRRTIFGVRSVAMKVNYKKIEIFKRYIHTYKAYIT